MAKVEWDRPEDRKFEVGVEKGVLYVNNTNGVPWNGLISVSETPTGGETTPHYQDGAKVYQHAPLLEYESEVTAFTYPDEFEQCIGMVEAVDGFLVGGQDRQYFGMSFQSLTGCAKSPKRPKIHLIYNAIATPSSKVYESITNEHTLTTMSWGITTYSEHVPGMRPTSHFILDPERMGDRLYSHIRDQLYGTDSLTPRLLAPEELVDLSVNWNALYPSPTTYPSLYTHPGAP